MKSLLVTGANGFIGKHVVSLLNEKGYQVKGISKSDGDLLDPQFCEDATSGCDALIHLAWSSSPHDSNSDPIADITANVNGALSLLQACIKSGTQRVVFVSSGGTVYGNPETVPIKEDHPIRPLSSYGIAKATVENYLHLFHHTSGLDYLVLRGANVYGPGQRFSNIQGVICQWLDCLRKGKSISIYGDGSQIRDYVYVSDFARAIAAGVGAEVSASVFNIGSAVGYSLLEILEAIKSVTGIEPDIEFIQQRNCDVSRNILDCTKAASNLNWRPEFSLEEGIGKTWDWIKAQETSDR